MKRAAAALLAVVLLADCASTSRASGPAKSASPSRSATLVWYYSSGPGASTPAESPSPPGTGSGSYTPTDVPTRKPRKPAPDAKLIAPYAWADSAAGRLSRQGAAVVIYNNVNDLDSFQYARAGHVVRDFDPLLFGTSDRAHALPQERGIRFGALDFRYLARSMLLAHRLTGLRLTLADVQRGRYDLAVAVRY
jgi:hypothetical protein